MQHIIFKLCLVAIYGLLLSKSVTSYCPCTKEYRPVCGDNWKTYSNPCLARCDGVGIKYNGQCYYDSPMSISPMDDDFDDDSDEDNCACPKIYNPVCGSNFRTYANKCLLDCARVMLLGPGPCRY